MKRSTEASRATTIRYLRARRRLGAELRPFQYLTVSERGALRQLGVDPRRIDYEALDRALAREDGQ